MKLVNLRQNYSNEYKNEYKNKYKNKDILTESILKKKTIRDLEQICKIKNYKGYSR